MTFSRQILPIRPLITASMRRGPDQDSKEAKQAGFRLDLREEAVDFEMIVPGKPELSPVIDVLTTTKASRACTAGVGKPQLKPSRSHNQQWTAEPTSTPITGLCETDKLRYPRCRRRGPELGERRHRPVHPAQAH